MVKINPDGGAGMSKVWRPGSLKNCLGKLQIIQFSWCGSILERKLENWSKILEGHSI